MELPLETPRLRLREWRPDEVAAVLALLGEPRTMGADPGASRVTTMVQAEAWLQKRLTQQRVHRLTMWPVEHRLSSELVGACGLFPEREALELCYIVDHGHRHKGYAAEAASAAIAIGRAAHPGWRIYATIRPDNKASARVAAALGLHYVETTVDGHGDSDTYEARFSID